MSSLPSHVICAFCGITVREEASFFFKGLWCCNKCMSEACQKFNNRKGTVSQLFVVGSYTSYLYLSKKFTLINAIHIRSADQFEGWHGECVVILAHDHDKLPEWKAIDAAIMRLRSIEVRHENNL